MRTETFFIAVLTALLMSCNSSVTVPGSFNRSSDTVRIFPDYKDIVFPANIAPLNFALIDKCCKAVVQITGKSGEQLLCAADRESAFRFNEYEWHKLTESNRGEDITFTIYTYDGNEWTEHPSFNNHIAREDIDRYISYRLIEPGYVSYHHLGIFQRDLQSYEQTTIYQNLDDDHCINCHTYRNYKTDNMMFHVREGHSGTIFVNGDNVEKVNTKAGPMYAACVYPAWHPRQNKIVFSTNTTGQIFFLKNSQKVEVTDIASDLVIYDVETKTVSPVPSDSVAMETFPAWSPAGDRLFYSASMTMCNNEDYHRGERNKATIRAFNKIQYDIWSMAYDETTGSFSDPELVFNSSSLGKSATLPRISPDGKWLLFTLGGWGQFHIWHKNSDLYVKNLETGETHPLENANSDDVDSYHSWSSNGKWIIFSTRREDETYTRPYICYFDENGKDYKPFALPQQDPMHSHLLLKSYNLPEFMIEPVTVPADKFRDVIYNTKNIDAKYQD